VLIILIELESIRTFHTTCTDRWTSIQKTTSLRTDSSLGLRRLAIYTATHLHISHETTITTMYMDTFHTIKFIIFNFNRLINWDLCSILENIAHKKKNQSVHNVTPWGMNVPTMESARWIRPTGFKIPRFTHTYLHINEVIITSKLHIHCSPIK